MIRKCSENIFIFLLIFVVFLGTSSASHVFCPADCPDCKVVPSCCKQKMGDDLAAEGMENTLPTGHQDGCNDRGACWDGASVDDVSRITPAIEHEPCVAVSYFLNEIQVELIQPRSLSGMSQGVTSNFPPIFLQNCSFLI